MLEKYFDGKYFVLDIFQHWPNVTKSVQKKIEIPISGVTSFMNSRPYTKNRKAS
jgi:hypothetical protein